MGEEKWSWVGGAVFQCVLKWQEVNRQGRIQANQETEIRASNF